MLSVVAGLLMSTTSPRLFRAMAVSCAAACVIGFGVAWVRDADAAIRAGDLFQHVARLALDAVRGQAVNAGGIVTHAAKRRAAVAEGSGRRHAAGKHGGSSR